MKTVQIPETLFIQLLNCHLFNETDEEQEQEIQTALETKLNALVGRRLYSAYKTATTPEEREKARQEYLDLKGYRESYRW
ncbi:complexin-2 [Bengtsoniella intestinalis]|uniref:complexin-2 n=1 Tax=Bengtsoniella intestinalis TaxID=3073143 RepID=UPI00391F563E